MDAAGAVTLLVFAAGFGAMVFFLTRAKRTGHERRETLAAARGWTYVRASGVYVAGSVPDNLLYRLSGGDGDRGWTLEARMRLEVDRKGMAGGTVLRAKWSGPALAVFPRDPTGLARSALSGFLSGRGAVSPGNDLVTVGIPGDGPCGFEALSDDPGRAGPILGQLAPALSRIAPGSELARNLHILCVSGTAEVVLKTCAETPGDMETMVLLGVALVS